MKKILLLITLTFLLTACNQELKVTEVDIENVNPNIQEIIEDIGAENGNYLIEGEKESYIFLNRINVIQGEEAIVLSDFTTDVKENILNIEFSEESTADFEKKDLKHQMLYKIKGGKDDYDTIKITSNGESTSFESVITD